MRRHTLRIRLLSTTVAVLVGALLAGCSIGAASDSSAPSDPAVGGAPVEIGGQPGVDGGVQESGGSSQDSSSRASGDSAREVISTGTISITSDDPLAAADAAVKIVEGSGGRIDSRYEQPALESKMIDGPAPDVPVGPSAQLVVRIPSAKLTDTLDAIKALGEVESVSISATDVTAQSRDLRARITALRTSVDRLTALLATATTTKDLIDIETALSTRQSELEGLESQERYLSDQVDLATISVSFGSVASAPIDQPSDFFSGIAVGWQTLVAFLGGVLVAAGFLLPWLVLLAILASIVIVIVRRRRSRRGGRVASPDETEATASDPTMISEGEGTVSPGAAARSETSESGSTRMD